MSPKRLVYPVPNRQDSRILMRSEGFAARLLQSGRGKYATRAVERLYVEHPELPADPSDRARIQEEVGRRLEALERALQHGGPEAFVASLKETAGTPIGGCVQATLSALAEVLAEDLPSSAFEEVEPVLQAARSEVARRRDTDTSFIDVDTPLGNLAAEFLGTVLEGDRRRASQRLIRALDTGVTPKDLMMKVLMPVQAEVGRLWHRGELAPAEEHLVTHTTELVLGQLYDRLPRDPSNGKVVVAGSISGDLHTIGVRVTVDFFEMDGWRAVFLGADVSPDSFLRGTTEFEADLVLIGATQPAQLTQVKEAVALIHQATVPRVPVLVGGPAFRGGEQPWLSTGAESCATTPDDAVRTGRRLVGLSG
jgi:MerR family transcriptional regulator, light-induced transcriptional regulator